MTAWEFDRAYLGKLNIATCLINNSDETYITYAPISSDILGILLSVIIFNLVYDLVRETPFVTERRRWTVPKKAAYLFRSWLRWGQYF